MGVVGSEISNGGLPFPKEQSAAGCEPWLSVIMVLILFCEVMEICQVAVEIFEVVSKQKLVVDSKPNIIYSDSRGTMIWSSSSELSH